MDDHEYAEVLRRTRTELTKQFARPTQIGVTLRGVTASSVDLIEGVESADVLLISGDEHFRSIAATSQLAIEVDDLQKRFGEGPCLDAATGHTMVVCNDLREDARWPRFAAKAVEVGVRSLLSFQLYTHDARMGRIESFRPQT